jgi:RNA polymerase sigma-70 factor (ECF subfamily)
MQTRLPDNDLIQQVLKGDQQAYKILVERYQSYIFTLALRMMQSREDAEEVAQDVFVKAYRSLADFKGGSKFSTWLYTIAHNTSITHLRKKRHKTHPIDDELVFTQLENQESDFKANQVEDKSRKAMVNRAIEMLSPEDANIITLFYKGEQSLDEISAIMGLETNTVKVRLFRARQKLKEKMEKFFSEDVSNLQTV